jgi:hypothetical protein
MSLFRCEVCDKVGDTRYGNGYDVNSIVEKTSKRFTFLHEDLSQTFKDGKCMICSCCFDRFLMEYDRLNEIKEN